ncbi:MAG: acyltransferase [Clostridiales bacterium]|nr:acyltransferase [Clostridiales bacterium]MDD7431780.1 acyltransferase family protein [Clostridiales bacterium]MDY3062112.1 acyltransferase family protein [Eubacteriales bacterium]
MTQSHVQQRHLSAFDFFRALFLLGVFFFHLDRGHFPYGYLGVVGFCCLAGFLSMRALVLEKEGQLPARTIRKSLLSRIGKLWPPLLLMLVTVAILMVVFFPAFLDNFGQQLRSSVLGYNNIWQIIHGESYFEGQGYLKPLTHLWALSLEMQFYLLFILFVRSSYRKDYKAFWICEFLLISVLSYVALLLFDEPGMDPTRVYYGLDTRLFSFTLGSAGALMAVNTKVAEAEPEKRSSGHRRDGVLLFLTLLLIAAFFLPVDNALMIRYGLMIYSLLCTAVLCLSCRGGGLFEKIGRWAPVAGLARRSYGLYLWHFPFFALSERFLANVQMPLLLFYAFEISGALFISELAYMLNDALSRPKLLQRVLSLLLAIVLLTLPWQEVYRLRGGEDFRRIEAQLEERESILAEKRKGLREAAEGGWGALSEAEKTEEQQGAEEGPAVKQNHENSPLSGNSEIRPGETRKQPADGTRPEGGKPGATAKKSQSAADSKPTGPNGHPLRGSLKLPARPKLSEEEKWALEAVEKDITAFAEYGEAWKIDLKDFERYRHLPLSMIGDSVSVIAGYAIDPYLPGLYLDAKSNRQTNEAFTHYQSLVQDKMLGEMLVMALGTNGDIDEDNLEEVWKALDGRPMLLLTIVLPYAGQEKERNDALRHFAKTHDQVWLVEWNRYAKSHPEFFQEDAIHPSTEGCKAFCQLITAKVVEVLRLYEDSALLEIKKAS